MKNADRNVRETGAESPTGADTGGPEDRIVPSDGRQEHHGLIQRCRSIIGDLAVRLERETPPLRVPRPVGERRRIAGSPYHPYPEVFIQLSGATDFRMPEDVFTLYPGELCIMPRFIPHREQALGYRGARFSNLVLMFAGDSLSFHIALESHGRPFVAEAERFEYRSAARLGEYLDDAVDLYWSSAADEALRGRTITYLLQALLHRLLVLLAEETPVRFSGHPTIARAKKLIEINLSNPNLSVRTLADWLRCSADYLSYLFHKETGETLVRHVTRRRIALASELLGRSGLTVSEVAWACGYDDAGYFSRIFKRITGKTPGEYAHRGG
jgi:AraC-like DNA-binding protein